MKLRFRGKLATLPNDTQRALFERSFSIDEKLAERVAAIIARVRREGDAALLAYASEFDHANLTSLEVPKALCEKALAETPAPLRRALERSCRNLARVAAASIPLPSAIEVEPGLIVGRRAEPLRCVGVYAPGGKAAYPSSVLMGVVPARAVGVETVVLCTPPGPDGLPTPTVLAAAALSRVDRVFAIGGAGAVAAMAYGTATVPTVDRIVGPGNAYVAEAKRQVAGTVAIDSPAGPSEILAVADANSDLEAIAREILAQAEHDPDACCVALVPSEAIGDTLVARIAALAEHEPRKEIIAASLTSRGAVLTYDTPEQVWTFIEAFAPEHLLLAAASLAAHKDRVRAAGTTFIGASSSVSFGDYLTGANHVLPTAGSARRFAGLSALDFVRFSTWQHVDPAAAAALAEDTITLATSEGLFAHAGAARLWCHPTAVPARAPLQRPSLAEVPLYDPPAHHCPIDLSDNTNLFGINPALERAIATIAPETLTRYPSTYAAELKRALAKESNVAPENIATDSGSDGILTNIYRAFAEPGDVLAYCPPTFSVIPHFARAAGMNPVAFPLDAKALIASAAKIIYLCAPNNPTGALLPPGLLDTLLSSAAALIILDEAYGDFSSVPIEYARAASHGRLIVTRTLSKAFGMAGLRVGWAVGPPNLVADLERVRGPYRITSASERAALAVLGPGRSWVRARVQETISLRKKLAEELVKRGYAPLPSEANFLLVPVSGSSKALGDRLQALGVAVRGLDNLPGIGGALRIGIGPWAMLETFLTALERADARPRPEASA